MRHPACLNVTQPEMKADSTKGGKIITVIQPEVVAAQILC